MAAIAGAPHRSNAIDSATLRITAINNVSLAVKGMLVNSSMEDRTAGGKRSTMMLKRVKEMIDSINRPATDGQYKMPLNSM